jgi:hypothetical protein
MVLIIAMSTKTTLMVVALMAALAVTIVSTIADSASARVFPPRPVPPGETTATCAQAEAGEGAADCPTPPPRGRGPPS